MQAAKAAGNVPDSRQRQAQCSANAIQFSAVQAAVQCRRNDGSVIHWHPQDCYNCPDFIAEDTATDMARRLFSWQNFWRNVL
jgi:hypothetical protein